MINAPKSRIVSFYIRFIFFFSNILAVYIFLRGHNEPGGGFIAGIVCAISLVILQLTLPKSETKSILWFDPVQLTLIGLLLAYATSIAPAFYDLPFLYHKMIHLHLPLLGDLHIGTPFLFDLGVFFVVVGVTAKITFMLSDTYEANEKKTMETNS